jgi:alkanesulfonate monooxygenase SsuD/methylene tetrahydromethanopterin reductase-like flavin-dependent oxidoreductase (luciferase family)
MSFGISLQTSPPLEELGDGDALSFVFERAREAEAAGVDDIWLNQGLDIDGITFAALVAREIPRALDSFIVPGITNAAAAAGRPAPRIAAGVPASVTDDPERARAHAFRALGGYARTPAYQAVLEREGITNVADLALIGDEETVAAGIRRYLDAGATDVRVSPAAFATDEERIRTWRLVGQLARDAGRRGGVL